MTKEKTIDPAYAAYAAQPTPGRLRAAVDAHAKTIDGAVNAMFGGRASPIVKRRAYLMAADAVKSYDPAHGVPLHNHIQTQLQPLRRVGRQVSEVISVPERVYRENAHLNAAREELRATLDREPTDVEIADHTGISVRRQRKLQAMSRPMLSESQVSSGEGADGEPDADPAVSKFDPMKEWEDYVYHDLDAVDKQIYAHRTGYKGAPRLSNTELSKRLKLSGAALSQRADRIRKRLSEGLQYASNG